MTGRAFWRDPIGCSVAGQDRKSGPGDSRDGSSEEELAKRLQSLDERLDRKFEERAPKPSARSDNTGFANALKLSSEFVAAILVGAGLGWGIDRLAGTSPWAMIVLLLLGFCAGVINVMRASGAMADPHRQNPRDRSRDGNGQGK